MIDGGEMKMIDTTWRLQGWAKLMTPKPRKRPTKAQIAARQRAEEDWNKRADEAIEWAKKFD
jgi:hypothetical protein